MANLQDQLGLGLAVRQTQQQNNNQNYSFESTNPLTGGTEFSAWIAIPQQNEIDLWGGAPFNYWPGGWQDHTMDSIDYSGNIIPSWYRSASVSSGISAPTSTTNVGIWDTFSWITPKRDKNIAQSATQVGIIPPVSGVPTVPVSPTLDINRQQRLANIAKRQWVAGVQPPIIPEKPEISPTGLQGAELQAYNQLTPQEQKTFQALATQGIKAQTDYLQQSKAAQEYKKSQEQISQDVEANRAAAEDIQARQQLESAARQVANLKQNIGYLWSQGQPGVSATKLDAVSNQVALAQKTYDDIVKIDQLNKANRALGQQSHALQFTREMTQLQDDLDSKVNKGIQSALNQFNAAELKGKLDTIPEIEAFQQQLYAQLDGDLSSIMDTNIEARKFLIERYDKLAESQKSIMQAQQKAKEEMTKRANTLNKEMSNALGYFVNENGDPLVDQKTGGHIVVPPETTTNYDASSGQLILLTKNRDGSVWVQMKQVWAPKATYQKVGNDPNTGEDIYWFVNPQAQTVTPYTGGGAWIGAWIRPTGNIVPVTVWGKTVRLDQSGASGFDNAISQLTTAGIPIVVWQGARDQATTIKEMAARYGIPFNPSNPAETAQKLRSAGHQVADPWKSNHESWMAIDVYGSSKLDAVSPAQEKILNANGWYSAGIPWDAGHFEYRWAWVQAKQESFDDTKKSQYQAYLESGKLPTGMKAWLAKTSQFEQEATAWKQANPDYLTKDEKKDLSWIQNNIATDPRRKDYLSMASKEKTLTWIQDRLAKWTATPQDKQQLINDFAKILDPTSVVREGEYALAGKYSQDKLTAMWQEISNYFATNGPLSDDAAKMLAEWVARRHIAIKQANDDAIDEWLANAKYILGRDVPPEWIGAKYSDINPKAKIQWTQKKLGITGWLKDFMSELTTLLQ